MNTKHNQHSESYRRDCEDLERWFVSEQNRIDLENPCGSKGNEGLDGIASAQSKALFREYKKRFIKILISHGFILLQVHFAGPTKPGILRGGKPYYVYEIKANKYFIQDDSGKKNWYSSDLFAVTEDYRTPGVKT